jgi:hypothetical protein
MLPNIAHYLGPADVFEPGWSSRLEIGRQAGPISIRLACGVPFTSTSCRKMPLRDICNRMFGSLLPCRNVEDEDGCECLPCEVEPIRPFIRQSAAVLARSNEVPLQLIRQKTSRLSPLCSRCFALSIPVTQFEPSDSQPDAGIYAFHKN